MNFNKNFIAFALVSLALAGCLQASPPGGGAGGAGSAPSSAASAPSSAASAPVSALAPASEAVRVPGYVERVVGGGSAEEALPMIIAIHGLGDEPSRFGAWLEGVDFKARLILPRGLDAYGSGYTWFSLRPPGGGGPDPAEVNAAADGIAALVRRLVSERPTSGRPVVLGFSQGGMLTFALASRHPELFAAALPIAGAPVGELPVPSRGVPLVAFHGEADARIAPEGARARVAALREAGQEAELRLYPGLGHQINGQVRQEVYGSLRRFLDVGP